MGTSLRQVPLNCPRCGGARIARLLWGDKPLIGESIPAALSETVLLGGRQMPEDTPLWACLTCQPGWREVHRLALQDGSAEVRTQEAIAQGDYEAAASCRDSQARAWQQQRELLSALVPIHPAWQSLDRRDGRAEANSLDAGGR